MKITYDKKADAIYIYFNNEPVSYTKDLGSKRYMDFDGDDKPRGIEFLNVSHGVKIDDLP